MTRHLALLAAVPLATLDHEGFEISRFRAVVVLIEANDYGLVARPA